MQIKDPMLRQVANAVLAHVQKPLEPVVDRAVAAGEHVMYAQQMRKHLMDQISASDDPAIVAGDGVAKLVVILYKQSAGKLPLQALLPAGQILVCEALQFLLDAGMTQKIDNDTVDRATQEYGSTVLQLLGVSPQKMQSLMAGQQSQPTQQPQPQQPQQQPGIISGAANGNPQ